MSSFSQESTASNETFGKDASIKLPQLIGSMSISPSGRDVVLGSKEGLHIIDLDSPYSPPRFLPHRTPWEVADVQWSPFAERDYWVVSTSNQKALVWNLAAVGLRNSIEFVLHGHTRAITDINFSAHHPDKLATCAVDSFIHCWDLRSPARPVNSFSDWFAGATQVKWSRQDEHVVASSHDKFLHIWDDRKGAYPARTIEAHDAKIYGIDWNRFEPSKIVTCSLDKTVKFWDTKNEETKPDKIIETAFPVWRARHTPFGWGLMVMPQRGDENLHLYDRRRTNDSHGGANIEPVQVFEGHKGLVKEFLWRPSGTVIDGIDHRDFQLVSWGLDRELKLHAVSKNTFLNVGYEKGVSKPQRLRFTRRGAKNRTFRDEPAELDTAIAVMSRTDSFPASNQFLRAKGRPSTNFGMSRVPVAQFKGWLQAGKHGKRTDMHGKGVSRPQADPIAWMRNVKIADALADEITQVGDKFKKVDFESVDVSQRRATMSLQSPWGEPGSAAVYTRLDFKFPKGYPKTMQAIIHVSKTNSITSETQKRLAVDIQKIAEAHAAKGRGCLEAVVRFLLREQSLDQIVDWITRDSQADSKLLDDANIPQDASDDSDDEQIVAPPNVAASSANVRVPLAKGCAGLWAENGKLVCFFLPKKKEPASFLSTIGMNRLDESESSKLFGGFGKFQVDSPSRKTKDTAQTIRDGSDTDSDEGSSMFSSSTSSSESSVGFEERARFVPWQRTTLDSVQRGKSAEGSQKSTTFEGAQARELVKSTTISIHDLSDILPAKQPLARDYKVWGNASTVCQHNAEVASRYALRENTSLWLIASKVLQSDKEQHAIADARETLELSSLMAKLHLLRQGKSSSFTALGPRFQKSAQPSYGEGVFGQTYLIPAIMQHLDQLCDLQMLATISAVFLQSKKILLETLMSSQSQTRQGLVTTPSFVESEGNAGQPNNHSSEARFGGLRHGATFNVAQQYSDQTDQSHEGRFELSSSVPLSTMHTGYLDSTRNSSGAPSVVAHDPSGFISAIHSTAVSVAGSPENHRLSRKSEGSVAYPMATASLYALTRSRPPSPPSTAGGRESGRLHRSSKSLRASPDDSFLNEARSRLKSTLSLVNVSGAGDTTPQTSRHGSSRQKSGLKGQKNAGSNKPFKKRLRTRFRDPILLCNPQSTALIEMVGIARQCVQYIQQYLPLLESWQLWIQKAEMQRILADTSNLLARLDSRRSTVTPKFELTNGLELRRCCPECGQPLAAIEKNGIAIGWHCISRDCLIKDTRPTKKQKCSICDVAVEGLSVPCLQCGHLTCYNCAQAWFVTQRQEPRKSSVSSFKSISDGTTRDQDELTCPTGCGCPCPLLTTIIVPDPSSETNEANSKSAVTPTTPRSDGFPETSSSRSTTVPEGRTHRGQSVHGPESALNALLALNMNMSSRHRSMSSTQTSIATTNTATPPQTASTAHGGTPRTRDNSVSISGGGGGADELLPWATDKNASLGRGFGGGLSRGLTHKGSDSTVRRAAR